MTERDEEEQRLRIEQMTVNIEKMRADMHWEFWKVGLQLIAALGAAFAGGAATLALILHLAGRL